MKAERDVWKVNKVHQVHKVHKVKERDLERGQSKNFGTRKTRIRQMVADFKEIGYRRRFVTD